MTKFPVLAAAAALALSLGAVAPVPAKAADIDYVQLFRERVLKCVHPMAKPADARIEIDKGPTTQGDITVTRLKVYYAGIIRRNSMDAEIQVRQSGSIRQMRVNVLQDSASETARCNVLKNWEDF